MAPMAPPPTRRMRIVATAKVVEKRRPAGFFALAGFFSSWAAGAAALASFSGAGVATAAGAGGRTGAAGGGGAAESSGVSPIRCHPARPSRQTNQSSVI